MAVLNHPVSPDQHLNNTPGNKRFAVCATSPGKHRCCHHGASQGKDQKLSWKKTLVWLSGLEECAAPHLSSDFCAKMISDYVIFNLFCCFFDLVSCSFIF